MPAQFHNYLLPKDVLKVMHLNGAERRFVTKHMGKSRRQALMTAPEPTANAQACAFVLDRMRDEPPEVQAVVTERIQASLAYDEAAMGRLQKFGTVDLTNIGVGSGIGQSTEVCFFDVVLSETDSPRDGVDWAAEFRADGGGPVVVDPKALVENRKIDCPWCEQVATGKRATQVMGKHVHDAHREKKTEWKGILADIKADFASIEGIQKHLTSSNAGFASQAEDSRVEGAAPVGAGTVVMEAKDV